ncbi:hypothetical protein SBA6_290024 [Candidatus Sulfopaludibacter sp. SbA6]|nr:hypothetical protein SBA6_290024 [Candidatus Sulfopaludibacter sp. SbA6]
MQRIQQHQPYSRQTGDDSCFHCSAVLWFVARKLQPHGESPGRSRRQLTESLEGWVKAEGGISETGRRVRFYTLTREGAKQLKREIAEYEQATAASLFRTRSTGRWTR